jgi:hypothetical protein
MSVLTHVHACVYTSRVGLCVDALEVCIRIRSHILVCIAGLSAVFFFLQATVLRVLRSGLID